MTMPESAPRSQIRADPAVERTRAVTGLFAVIAADIVIALAAALGTIYTSREAAKLR